MRERGFGRIVNISSINGQKGQFGQTNYCAAKAGILGFTKALALETASKGVTVNAIAPGYIDTEMVAAVPKDMLGRIVDQIPVARLGQPSEIARIVEFLVSDEAAFITGATIAANAGSTCPNETGSGAALTFAHAFPDASWFPEWRTARDRQPRAGADAMGDSRRATARFRSR